MKPKIVFLHACRALGLFRLARLVTRKNLRILCYHGFSLDDEHEFRNMLFITEATFRQRLRYLRDQGFVVLPLAEALERLARNDLPADACAVTIDDGFFSTKQVAHPLLSEFGFPYTVYVTTYYCEHNSPIFRLAVQYVLWKSGGKKVDLEALGVPRIEPRIQRDGSLIPGDAGAIIDHGERNLDEDGRIDLTEHLAAQLGVDYAALRDSRRMSLMTPAEVREIAELGVDIQLHTHTHRIPEDPALATWEIKRNAESLAELSPRPLEHFCYPSGRWSEKHFPVLEALGVRSATTTDRGLADRADGRYQIPRLLDREAITQISFESEVSGFGDFLRWVKGKLRPRGAG